MIFSMQELRFLALTPKYKIVMRLVCAEQKDSKCNLVYAMFKQKLYKYIV